LSRSVDSTVRLVWSSFSSAQAVSKDKNTQNWVSPRSFTTSNEWSARTEKTYHCNAENCPTSSKVGPSNVTSWLVPFQEVT
jgi:hypothetical protein